MSGLFKDLRRRRVASIGDDCSVLAAVVLGAFLVDSLGAPTLFNSLYALTVAIFIGGALTIGQAEKSGS